MPGAYLDSYDEYTQTNRILDVIIGPVSGSNYIFLRGMIFYDWCVILWRFRDMRNFTIYQILFLNLNVIYSRK